jgi:hypothetical protein
LGASPTAEHTTKNNSEEYDEYHKGYHQKEQTKKEGLVARMECQI